MSTYATIKIQCSQKEVNVLKQNSMRKKSKVQVPRLRSRPKFSSDQTFQTKIISDQTFQTEINPDQTFQTQVLWSDFSDRRSFWSDHLQTMVQTQIQTIAQTSIRLSSDSSALEEAMIRLKCARKILIADRFYL